MVSTHRTVLMQTRSHTEGCTFDLFNSSYYPNGDHTRIPWIGKFPFQNPYYEKFGIFGVQRLTSRRECCCTHCPQTFHLHRCVQFQLGSPCERGWLNHEGHVVSGGIQDVCQHLWTQGSPPLGVRYFRTRLLSLPCQHQLIELLLHDGYQATPFTYTVTAIIYFSSLLSLSLSILVWSFCKTRQYGLFFADHPWGHESGCWVNFCLRRPPTTVPFAGTSLRWDSMQKWTTGKYRWHQIPILPWEKYHFVSHTYLWYIFPPAVLTSGLTLHAQSDPRIAPHIFRLILVSTKSRTVCDFDYLRNQIHCRAKYM
jgi:hypothetical protein